MINSLTFNFKGLADIVKPAKPDDCANTAPSENLNSFNPVIVLGIVVDIVISFVPSKATPLIFLAVANLVAFAAVDV